MRGIKMDRNNKKKLGEDHLKLLRLCNYINSLYREYFYITWQKGTGGNERIAEITARLDFVKTILSQYPLVQKYRTCRNKRCYKEFTRSDYRNVHLEAKMMILRIICFEEDYYKKHPIHKPEKKTM